jgi:peroxiredoxin
MLRLRRHTSIIIIGVALLAINIFALRKWLPILHTSNTSNNLPHTLEASTILRYGGKIPVLSGKSLVGDKTVNVEANRANLILIFSPSQRANYSIAVAKAAESLWHRIGKEALNITAFVTGDIPDLKSLVEHSLINYDVLSDQNGELSKRLGVGKNENAVLLFDTDGVCRFSTDYVVTSDDLRQLVAMEVLPTKPVYNSDVSQFILKEGNLLADWPLINARSFERVTLNKARPGVRGHFVLFTADCSICSLPGYLKKFVEFEHKLQSSPDQKSDAILVFDFNFPQSDVIEQLNKSNIKTTAYIANEELQGLTELVSQRDSNLGRVVVVQTDQQQRIVKISPLDGIENRPISSPKKDAWKQPVRADGNTTIYEKMFDHTSIIPFHVTAYSGKYFVSDLKSNRVLVLNEHQQVEREIGGIGSGPGRLLHPNNIGVSNDGELYVYDAYNDRIEGFAADGSYKSEFQTTRFKGFGVTPKGEIYLGQPEKGSLITVYTGSGKRLRSFGQLKKFSEIYGPKFSYKDDLYRLGINRINLAIDKDGNTYVSFMLAPLIQKYNPEGQLLFERRLEGPEIDHLTRVLLTETEDIYVTTSLDGFQEKIIAIDPVIEPETGNVYAIFIDGSVSIIDPDGNPIDFLRSSTQQRFSYTDTSGVGAKGEVLVVSYKPRLCFRLARPIGAKRKDLAITETR